MEDKIIGISNREYLPLMSNSVPEIFRLKAEKELHETEENVKKGLAMVRDCIKRNQLQVNSDASYLLPYLRQVKFDSKKAVNKLIHSGKFLEKLEGEIACCDLKRVQAVIDHKFAGILPVRDREGRAVIFTRASAWRKDLFDMFDATMAVLLLFMFGSTFPLTSICGITYITDAKLSDLNNITDYLPMSNVYRKYLPYLKYLPLRIQRMDMINTQSFCRYVYKGVRHILSSKLRDRVFLNGSNLEDFHKAYHPSILPSEFGGTTGTINAEAYKDKFMEYARNIQDQLKKKTIK